MLQIKQITEGEYATYQSYMDSLLNAIDVIINPHMFTIDGVNYAVCKEGPVIAISEKLEDDTHMSYAVLMDETGEKLERLVDEYYLLELFLENDIPVVSRRDLSSMKLEQFFVTWAQENQPHDWLHYYVCNGDESAEMEYQYDITHVKSYLNGYLHYLNSKDPDLITINRMKKVLGILTAKKKDSYLKLADGSGYGKSFFEWGDQVALVRAKTLSFNDVKGIARDLELDTEVPEELMTAFTGTNNKVKTLELIGKEYNRIIGGKGV